jgi:hypothetical protein
MSGPFTDQADYVGHAVGLTDEPSLRSGSGESRRQCACDHDHDDLRILCLSHSGKFKAIENTGCCGFRKQHADIVAALKNGGGIVGGRCFNNIKAFPLKGIGCHGANVRIGLHNENNSLGGGFCIVHGGRDT